MPAPKTPNTEAARAASLASRAAKREAERRSRLRDLPAESRAALAKLMQNRLDTIPGKIAELEKEREQIIEWLEEFDPIKK